MLDETTRKKLSNRLKRAEGQLGAVRRMVDEEAYCVDILTQVAAVEGALRKINQMVLESHIQTCVSDAFAHGDTEAREAKIRELVEVFARYGS